jgi:hypothetical protein
MTWRGLDRASVKRSENAADFNLTRTHARRVGHHQRRVDGHYPLALDVRRHSVQDVGVSERVPNVRSADNSNGVAARRLERIAVCKTGTSSLAIVVGPR